MSSTHLLLQGFVALLHYSKLPCALLHTKLARVLAHPLCCQQRL
jgi:hypothetical protein